MRWWGLVSFVVAPIAIIACESFGSATDDTNPSNDASSPSEASNDGPTQGMDGSPLDASIDGDTGCADSISDECRERVIFITSAQKRGDLMGLAGADAICTSAAQSGVATLLNRTFLAWLGTSKSPVNKRHVASKARYVLVNGTVVANDWSQLLSGTLAHAIDMDETGTTWTSSRRPWTGLYSDGGFTGQSCGDWMDAASTAEGTVGSIATLGDWTFKETKPCDSDHQIYCIEK